MKKIIFGISVLALSSCGQTVVGPKGDTGANGTNGLNGSNCTVTSVQASQAAPSGGSLIACPDGSQSLVLNGVNGTNGINGTDGTVVTAIQFCSGVTPTYPSNFPEVGFCIDNVLYAVYSANDGFLSEVTPGAYSSNGINASCNFTVSANCVVTQ